MLDILFGRRVESESNILTFGDVVYTSDEFYSPDIIEAWKKSIEKKLQFLGITIAWRYTDGTHVEVRTLFDPDFVIEEIEHHNMSLEVFARQQQVQGPR